MPRLFVGNFDFEYRLPPSRQKSSNEAITLITRELAAIWVGIADHDDYAWMPRQIEPAFFEQLVAAGLPSIRPASTVHDVPSDVELCPWGWNSPIRNWATANNWQCRAPTEAAIAEANSRRTSSQHERRSGTELHGSAELRSAEQFYAAVSALPSGHDRWVVKDEFGMSGRERIVGQGIPNVAAVNWVTNRLGGEGILFFEPWVTRLEEVGLQFTVPESGPIEFEGCTPLLAHRSGQYRGSRFAHDATTEAKWQPAIEVAARTLSELQQRGYFGPVGIDAMRYRDCDGRERIRPLQDINARYTMGRIALGFRRLLTPGQQGSWIHVRWSKASDSPQRWVDDVARQLPAETRLIPTTPFSIDNGPTEYGSLVVIAPDVQSLDRAEQIVLACG